MTTINSNTGYTQTLPETTDDTIDTILPALETGCITWERTYNPDDSGMIVVESVEPDAYRLKLNCYGEMSEPRLDFTIREISPSGATSRMVQFDPCSFRLRSSSRRCPMGYFDGRDAKLWIFFQDLAVADRLFRSFLAGQKKEFTLGVDYFGMQCVSHPFQDGFTLYEAWCDSLAREKDMLGLADFYRFKNIQLGGDGFLLARKDAAIPPETILFNQISRVDQWEEHAVIAFNEEENARRAYLLLLFRNAQEAATYTEQIRNGSATWFGFERWAGPELMGYTEFYRGSDRLLRWETTGDAERLWRSYEAFITDEQGRPLIDRVREAVTSDACPLSAIAGMEAARRSS